MQRLLYFLILSLLPIYAAPDTPFVVKDSQEDELLSEGIPRDDLYQSKESAGENLLVKMLENAHSNGSDVEKKLL